MALTRIRLALLTILFGFAASFVGGVEASERSAQEGVYTAEQAQRGRQIYQAECASCHAPDMQGGPAARSLSGVTFRFQWQDSTLAEFFDAMRNNMPPGKAGTLSDQAYVDLLAAILQRNEFPAGNRELEVKPAFLGETFIRWRSPE